MDWGQDLMQCCDEGFEVHTRARDWKQDAIYDHRGHPGKDRSIDIQVAGPEAELGDWHCFCPA